MSPLKTTGIEELKELVSIRKRESKALFDSKNYSGSYYLAGYIIECALKVCIAKKFNKHVIPDKKFVNEIYCHDLDKLLQLSDLQNELNRKSKSDASFERYWAVIKDWSEQKRYETTSSRALAFDIYKAITSRKSGVLVWIKQYW